MAPNPSGIESADAARIAHLVELAVEFAQTRMKPEFCGQTISRQRL
jgi:23S rRNA (uridine2552-2'-O)-methyltransferase